MNKNKILKQTIQVSTSSLFSKFLGIIREVLVVRYLGVGQISDAFVIAYKIPDTLKRVLAEGAMGMAFIPTLVKIIKNNEYQKANKLLTFLVFILGLLMLTLCCFTLLFAKHIILLFAPGFLNKAFELTMSANLLSIFMFFVFFISLSSMFAGVMQAKGEFLVPSLGTVWLNVIYISGLLLCMSLGLSVYVFSVLLAFGGLAQLIFFYQICKNIDFKFFERNWLSEVLNHEYLAYIKDILFAKFLPCFLTMSIVEIYFLIDARFASTCMNGSVTLINVAFKFMAITLSCFSGAFSSILLPHFSKVMVYAPKRSSFYLLESSKFMFWVTMPVMLFMVFFADKIFYTAFYRFSANFGLLEVSVAGKLLIAFVSGLLFHSLNRLFVAICYSKNRTFVPLIISMGGALVNICFNFILVPFMGVYALPVGTTIAGLMQSILLLLYLSKYLEVIIHINAFLLFSFNCLISLFGATLFFLVTYEMITSFLNFYGNYAQDFFLNSLGLWLWVLPLFAVSFALFYKICKYRHTKIYFLD